MEYKNDYCLIGSCTDVGKVRRANEDSMDWFDCPTGRVVVVCDGMGGHVGGQIASQTAVKAIRQFLTANNFDSPSEAITNSIITANQAILREAQARPELTGMGSTCVMLIIKDGVVYYGHVGDSRIYFVANHRIKQLTKDQSFVQSLVDAGAITPEEAEHHPRKNEITNALGIPSMTPPIVCDTPIMPEAGNCFVLCSDGLSGMIPDSRIEHIVSRHDVNIADRAKELVAKANEAGGRDNITVQLVEFSIGAADIVGSKGNMQPSGGQNGKNKKIAVIAVACVVALVIACAFIFRGKFGGEADGPDSTKVNSDSTLTDMFKDSFNGKMSGDTLVLTIEGDRVKWKDESRIEVSLGGVVEVAATDKFTVASKEAKKVSFMGLNPDTKLVNFEIKDKKIKDFEVELLAEGKLYKLTIVLPAKSEDKATGGNPPKPKVDVQEPQSIDPKKEIEGAVPEAPKVDPQNSDPSKPVEKDKNSGETPKEGDSNDSDQGGDGEDSGGEGVHQA